MKTTTRITPTGSGGRYHVKDLIREDNVVLTSGVTGSLGFESGIPILYSGVTLVALVVAPDGVVPDILEATTSPVSRASVPGKRRAKDSNYWKNLIVRACKTERPSLGRLRRIMARRCAVSPPFVHEGILADYMMEILEELKLITLRDFVWRLYPGEFVAWGHVIPDGLPTDSLNNPVGHPARVISLVTSLLANAEVSRIPWFVAPSRFSR